MKVVSINKQSKKAQKAFHATKRGTWYGVNPVTKVVPSGKQYSRAKAKAAARKNTDPLGIFYKKTPSGLKSHLLRQCLASGAFVPLGVVSCISCFTA